MNTPLDGPTAAWVSKLPDTLRGRLVSAGLLDDRPRAYLAAFIDDYIRQRMAGGDVASGTVGTWRDSQAALVEYFGADKPLHEITTADADKLAAWLRTEKKYAENSARLRARHAKQFFAKALEYGIIDNNPFVKLAGAVRPNRERQVFVGREVIERVLPECSNDEQRLLVIMARYMGLRVFSEIRTMRWVHVNWATWTMSIRASKTARHKGGGVRVCPIFPEVQRALLEASEAAPEGAEYIFPTLRHSTECKWFSRAIVRAGLKPWPKPWNSLRATRATELADVFPSHVCAAWLGHSEAIADANYRQVTPEHIARATAEPTAPVPTGTKTGALTACNAFNSTQAEETASAITRENKGLDDIVCDPAIPSGKPPSHDVRFETEGPPLLEVRR
ncbi:MAG: phage integrase SAM-like domain-containing protein [Thermoguttaceae bacterium]|nr:phage integrase SAM-like domain-containing protein [Thermoguttaceae bacterium]